ncbi:MAG: glycosyltransferase family 39 protein [Deltaproteobacteria bacterium]|nr:glycosyltransferase family 39 protein [Deltaproteobacteria bacterium]
MSRALPFAALAAVFLVTGPLVLGDGVDLPDDALYYGVASWEWLATAARSGSNPWWVPGKLGGVSLFSDVVPQGPFYPSVWLGLLMPAIPAMGLAALLHALGTLFAVRWLARLQGIRRELAWLAGTAVAAGPLAVWAAIDFQVDAWPTFLWFPVVLGCLQCSASAREVKDRASWLRWVALGGMATALLLLGSHLRLAVAAGAALALWSLIRGRDLPGATLTGALGLAGGLPAILPMVLEARAQETGGGLPLLGTEPDLALGLWNLPGWLAPKVMLYDRDLGLGTLIGVGVVVAAVGLLRAEPRWRRTALFSALLLLAGSRIPGARQLLAPLTLLTHPVNLVYPALALIPLAVLGAGGLEWLMEGRRLRERDRRWAIGIVAVLGGLAVARFALGSWVFPSPLAHGLYALALGQLALVAVVAFRWTKRDEVPVAALVLLAIADLALFGVRAHLAVPAAPLRSTADVRGERMLLAEGFLDVEDLANGFELPSDDGQALPPASQVADEDSQEPARRRGEREQANEEEVVAYELEAPRVQERLLERAWPVHVGMALNVQGLAGRSKMMPRRASALLGPVAAELADLDDDPDVLEHLFSEGGRGWRLLEVFGARTAMWDGRVVAQRPRSDGPCRLITETTMEPNEDRRVAALLDRAGAAGPALLEAPLAEGPPLGLVQMFCDSSRGRITQSVAVPQGKRALAAVRIPLHPGWSASSDSGDLLPLAIDQVHQGVILEAGEHRMAWRFEPPGLRASLIAAGLAWLLMLAGVLLGRGRRPVHPAALGALWLSVGWLAWTPSTASAAQGTLLGAEEGVSYEVLLTSSLNLADPTAVRGRATLGPEQPHFTLPSLDGDAWVFLRQEIPREGAPPLVFYRPADLLPLAGDAPVTLQAVPRDLALLRASGEPQAGWWAVPGALAGVVVLGFPLLRRRLRRGTRGSEPRAEQSAPLPARPARAVGTSEKAVLAAVLLLALGLRLPGMMESLDLLEWSYGPGTTRVVAADDPAPSLLETILNPACLELVHPPLWHWLEQGIDAGTGGVEWAARLPALLLSLATSLALWWLLRPVSAQSGLLAAGAFAVAPPAVHFGRDATPYALLAFVAVASLLLLLRALRRGTAGAWVAWLALLVAGFLSHYGTVFFAAAQVGGLLVLAATAADRTPWRLAAAQACRAGGLVLPVAVAWSFLHFARFAPTALDTRLYADTYPSDPGIVRFLAEFGSVGLGLPPVLGLGAVAVALLMALGASRLLAADRPLAVLLLMSVVGFVAGCVFFYANLVGELGGRVFWGFRWVSWFLPLALALAAVGVRRRWTWALALLWGLSAVGSPWVEGTRSTRPDYRSAAEHIAQSLADRDGLAALPLWGQRGPVRTYLTRALDGRFETVHETLAWNLDGKAAYLEMIDERFPFETSVRNGHVDRVWVVVADEQMFGREKFRGAIAAQAMAFAHEEMDLVEERSFGDLTLALFARRPVVPPGPMNPSDMTSIMFAEPNAPPCQQPEDDEWSFAVRGHFPRGSRNLEVRNGTAQSLVPGPSAQDSFAALIRGGPCGSTPPVVGFGR